MKKKFLLKYYDNILNYLRCHFWSLIDENYRNAMATTLMTTKKYILVLGITKGFVVSVWLGFFLFFSLGGGGHGFCLPFFLVSAPIFGFPHRRSGFCCCFRLFWFWFQVLNDLREAFLQDMGDLRVLCS